MSGGWSYGEEQRRSPGIGKLAVLVIIILLVADLAVLGFIFMDLNLQNSRLSSEVQVLQFQVTSTNSEVTSLREEVRMLRLTNSSLTILPLTQIYNQTRRSVVLITVQLAVGTAHGPRCRSSVW